MAGHVLFGTPWTFCHCGLARFRVVTSCLDGMVIDFSSVPSTMRLREGKRIWYPHMQVVMLQEAMAALLPIPTRDVRLWPSA